MFKPGDVVRLKSGGPLMTVVKVDAEHCYCHWFPRADADVRSHTFLAVTLRAPRER